LSGLGFTLLFVTIVVVSITNRFLHFMMGMASKEIHMIVYFGFGGALEHSIPKMYLYSDSQEVVTLSRYVEPILMYIGRRIEHNILVEAKSTLPLFC